MADEADKLTRRELFRSIGRIAALGGVAAGTGALAAGRRVRAAGRQTCVGGGVCSGCSAFEDCGLPTALSAKAHRKNP